jgi:hypothetical protein
MALGSCNSIQKGLTKTVNKKSKMKITAQRTSELWTLGGVMYMCSSRMKWSVGSLAFFLPGLVGFIGDFLEGLPAINSRESSRLLDFVFGASVLLAVVVPTVFITTTPTTLARRLGFTAAVWCLVFLEVYIVFMWSLRYVH